MKPQTIYTVVIHSCDSYELQEFDLVIHWCNAPMLCEKVAQEAFSPYIMIIADLWAQLPLCTTGWLLNLPGSAIFRRAQSEHRVGGGSSVPRITNYWINKHDSHPSLFKEINWRQRKPSLALLFHPWGFLPDFASHPARKLQLGMNTWN